MREQLKPAASVGYRAPPCGGEASGPAFWSASDDDVGGLGARCASSSNQLRASDIARRRAEEKRADPLFGLRVTTTSAALERDARAAQRVVISPVAVLI